MNVISVSQSLALQLQENFQKHKLPRLSTLQSIADWTENYVAAAMKFAPQTRTDPLLTMPWVSRPRSPSYYASEINNYIEEYHFASTFRLLFMPYQIKLTASEFSVV